MANPALAYALLRATFDDKVRNPVDAVIPIIKRALFRYGPQYLTPPDLQNRIIDIWGLEIPLNVIQYCLPRLASQNIVIFDANAHQYRLVNSLYSEDAVLKAEEIARAKYDRAQQHLDKVLIDLDVRHLTALDVIEAWLDTSSLSFLGGTNPASSAGSEDWLVKEIIAHALSGYIFSTELVDDLTDIALGDSLYRAVKALTEFNTEELDASNLRQPMDGVDVYLDTQIIIRALGYSRDELNRASTELLTMCRRTGCNLKAFKHTIEELEGIIRNSINTLETAWSHTERRSGYDVVAYARENGLQPKELFSLIVELPTRLAELKIEVSEAPSVVDDIQLSVDEKQLIEDLSWALAGQSEKARNTDVDSITAIYRLRKGKAHRFLERCGAIFVTSNKGLSDVATRFFQNHYRDSSQTNIVQHVMTNVVFVTRLWPKLPTAAVDIPRKQLVAYSVSNLFPSSAAQESFLAEIRSMIASGKMSEDQAVRIEISRHLDECIFLEMGHEARPVTKNQTLSIINKINRLEAARIEQRSKGIDEKAEESIRLLREENDRLKAELLIAKRAKDSAVALDDADVGKDAEQIKKIGHLVVLIHGMNTNAHWMDNISPVFEKEGFKVAKVGYGVMSPIKFLAPVDWFKNYAVKRVVDDLRAAIERHQPKQLSVIAHSFGTYVFANILKDYPEFTWRWVIFCGSVVRSDFPINDYSERFRSPLLNEVGLSDWWPAFAEKSGWSYGSVGSNGLKGACVESRWHKQTNHGDFLTEKFCKRYWIPFLKHGRVIGANPAEQMPLMVRLLTWFPYKYVFLIAYALLFVLAPLAAVAAALYFSIRLL